MTPSTYAESLGELATWLAALMIALAVGGCSIFPTETSSRLKQEQRESIAGRTTADVVTQSKTKPPVVIIEDGKVRVEVPVEHEERTHARTQASESADAAESLFERNASGLSLAVKLVIGAVGLGLLAAVVFWIIRKIRQGAAGAAAAAAFKVADSGMANVINALQARVLTERDPATKEALLSELAAMEKARGKLAAEAKGN